MAADVDSAQERDIALHSASLLSLSLSQKIAYDAQICFSLLHVRQMGALLKDGHPGMWDTLAHCLSTRRCDLVIPPYGNQGRRRNLTQAIRAIPVLEVPDHHELIRPIHGFVDRIVDEVGDRALN